MPNTGPDAVEVIHVAVGAILNEGRVLLAERPVDSHQGGLWEFPGGKVEPGESVAAALVRELEEELGIHVDPASLQPLIRIRHDYPDKSVLLDVHTVARFEGEAHGRQGQPVFWQSLDQLPDERFPAANRPIIRALRLPSTVLVTGPAESPASLPMMLSHALHRSSLGMVILRCPGLDNDTYASVAADAVAVAHDAGAKLILHDRPDLVVVLGADGVHLSQRMARQCRRRPVPVDCWLSVSCHNEDELREARKIGADFVTLSPVLPTPSHPDAVPLGWERFSQLAGMAGVPVFALGGVGPADVASARAAGAQGIAGIRAWWPTPA